MPNDPVAASGGSTLATAEEINQIVGALDEAKLLEILALRPTVLDLEEAALWLSGDRDIFGAGQPLQQLAGDIVAIVTSDEEDERAR